MESLKGKSIIITGAASGMGAATATMAAARGASVVLGDIDSKGASAVAKSIVDAGGIAIPVKNDVSNPDDAKKLVAIAVKEFGGLHGAVNNAGVAASGKKLHEESLNTWDRTIAINLSSVFYGMQAQIPEMLKSGGGSIVNVSSVTGVLGAPGAAAYTAAKHGVVGLTQVAAIESSSDGIRVNAIGPGYIETKMMSERLTDETHRANRLALHPIGRFGVADEAAALILFLLSDEASFITGAFYPVDGGFSAA
ncbi:MAG: glucose 1-dehydrogenase [Leucobacter sp.]